MVVVPLYDTLGPDAIRFIINTGETDRQKDRHTHAVVGQFKHVSSSSPSPAGVSPADISTVICDKVDKAEVLLENVEKKETPGLRRIVLMDAVQPHLVARGQHCGVHVQAMQELEVERWGGGVESISLFGALISINQIYWLFCVHNIYTKNAFGGFVST